MSEKKNVCTFQIRLLHQDELIEGPIVSPDKSHVAEHLTDVHNILRTEDAILVYSKQWIYVPRHVIHTILRGKTRFLLPWPLTNSVHPPA